MEKEKLNPDLIPYIDQGTSDFCFIKHLLCWSHYSDSPDEESEWNTIMNLTYQKNQKRYNEYLESKDYKGILFVISQPLRMGWFYSHYKTIYKEIGEDEYYLILRGLLTDIEYHYFSKTVYSELFNIGKDPLKMMGEGERKLYDKLPERITIYRGINDKERITRNNFQKYVGNSWTLDKQKSIWFSNRLEQKYRVVLSTEISKSQVLSYFIIREEEEILVDYEKLDYSKIHIEEVKSSKG